MFSESEKESNFNIIFYSSSAASLLHPKNQLNVIDTMFLDVYVGRFNFSDPYEKGAIKVDVAKISIHSGWNASETKYSFDIAILTLSEPVSFGELIKRAKLPKEGDDEIGDGFIVGWGKDNLDPEGPAHTITPNMLKTPFVTASQCYTMSDAKLAQLAYGDHSFCAGYLQKLKDLALVILEMDFSWKRPTKR